MIRRGALLAVSTSGGKDSQAMTILLSRSVPRDRLVAVHSPLGEAEWSSTVEYIEAALPDGVPLILAPVSSYKSLLDRIEERDRFPSPSVKWCTSVFYAELNIDGARAQALEPLAARAVSGRMLKTLLLMRHAKSSWDDPSLDDFDRPLDARGRKAAPRMGGYIEDNGLIPDLVVCSTARRAHETWKLAGKSMGGEVRSKSTKGLYLASPGQLLRVIQRVSDGIERLLVIAHNPGIQELAIRLEASDGDGRASGRSDEMRAKFPTAALAILSVNARCWSEVAYGKAQLVDFIRPRQLR